MTVKAKIQEILKDQNLPLKIHQYAFVNPADIPFSTAVHDACKQNYCGMYAKCWTCPPGVGNLKKLEEHYKAFKCAFVFTTKHQIEDSFDFEGMLFAKEEHRRLDDYMVALLDKTDGFWELTGAGGCNLCEKCTYPNAPCRFPKKARRAMEACGMDVMKLSQIAGINYINGENTVTYFSVIFFN